jgi:hypothetical protein
MNAFKEMDFDSSGTINLKKFLRYVDNIQHAADKQTLFNIDEKKDFSSPALLSPVTESQSNLTKDLSKKEILERSHFSMAMASNRRLSLSSRNINDDNIKVIADNLLHNLILRFLILSRNNIGLEGIKKLCVSLRSNNTLTRLDLSSNKFGSEGVILIAETLHVNSSIQRLDLCNTLIDVKGARAIAQSLMVNKSLQELNLRGDHMGNEAVMLVGNALRYNTVLKKLFLQENDIDPEPGMRSFTTSLYSCDVFVLEKLEGIDLLEFSRILDIIPDPCLDNDKILSIMRGRRGKNAKKKHVNNK